MQVLLLTLEVSMEGQLATAQDIQRFMLAGNATFTIRSKRSGTRFTYKVRRIAHKNKQEPQQKLWFVSLLNGPCNENSFCYMGIIENAGSVIADSTLRFRFTQKSTVNPTAPSAKAFTWFFNVVVQQGRNQDQVECWHEGRCGRCGRKLTVPESINNGIGPECASKGGL